MGLEGACRGLVCLPMTILTPVTSVNCLPLELNSFDKRTLQGVPFEISQKEMAVALCW